MTDNEAIIEVLEQKVPRYVETISRCLSGDRYFDAVRCMMELISNLTVVASGICSTRLTQEQFHQISDELEAMDSPIVGVDRKDLNGEES